MEMKTVRNLVDYIGIYGMKTASQMKDDTTGDYRKYSFDDLQKNAKYLAAYFDRSRHFGKGDMVVLYSENRPEWMMAYFGIIYNGLWAVPFDAKLTDLEVKNLINDCKAKIMITSKSCYDNICGVPELMKQIKEFIIFEDDRNMKKTDRKIRTFAEVIEEGEKHFPKSKGHEVTESDVASLIYTSGTTGNPKGVLLTHRNFTHQYSNLHHAIPMYPEDTELSVLPLHHTFEFSVELALLFNGSAITYAESMKPNKLLAAIHDTNVTILIAVPLLYEKIYEGIMRQVRNLPPVVKQVVFGLYYLTSGLNKITNNNAGKSIFKFLRKKANLETVKFAVSGAAPLNYKVAKGFETLGLTLLNGYGLTESSPVVAVNRLDRKVKNESVGLLVEQVEAKIFNPDASGHGEVMVFGPNIMKGYYKNPKATKEVIDKDGWLYTGDIGMIDSEGYLYITGRKKNIIVTPGGKNVYPEEIEDLVNSSPYILESLVIGVHESEHSKGENIYAYIVPNYEYFDTYGNVNNVKITEDFIQQTIDKYIREVNALLADYKKIRGWRLRREEFQKTSTKKIKRYLFSGEDFLNT
jgi:long-chain acyl-CoA synthetase